MADRKFFRTAMRGFHKDDVLNHIDALHAEQQKALEEMREQVAKAQEEAKEAKREAAEAVALPKEQLAELEQLREKTAAYEKEIAELRTTLEESNATRGALWEQQRQLEQTLEAATAVVTDVETLNVQLAERLATYRKLSNSVVEEIVSESVQGEEEPPVSERAVPEKQPMAEWLY